MLLIDMLENSAYVICHNYKLGENCKAQLKNRSLQSGLKDYLYANFFKDIYYSPYIWLPKGWVTYTLTSANNSNTTNFNHSVFQHNQSTHSSVQSHLVKHNGEAVC